jgi:lyso-ornithine lipid O-acyltransferase
MIPGWFRGSLRMVLLVETLCESVVRFFFLSLGRQLSVRDRAEWLHRSCVRVLRRMSFASDFCGPLPARGLIVSNHLSHLDILLYGSTLPCVFVAKSEVRRWPIFGLLASLAGTVFIERGNPVSTAAAAQQIEALLKEDVPVMLFPEGTSSDGATVLRFHSALFQSAIRAQAPITPAAVRYCAGPEVAEKDLCYYGDVRFGPHLLATLGHRQVRGILEFAPQSAIYPDRRTAARQTWRLVMRLRGNPMADENDAVSAVVNTHEGS